MKQDRTKTNALRLLDRAGVEYQTHSYDADACEDGVEVAAAIGAPTERVFKTLVTRARSGQIYVFSIPVDANLNLKRAAALVSEKSLEMIHVRELLSTTGYIRGGCSPIGMKKRFPVAIDETALQYERIFLSAGQRGLQMELRASDLASLIPLQFAALCD
ncbi:MAG: Cys-tRNA(Pro) deacylase [Eubacteriales bacterium]|nr:Cys-tRNA(Pro) deacylase [Eubacteriales bacterium]